MKAAMRSCSHVRQPLSNVLRSAIFVAEVERAPYLLLAPWVNLARVAFLGGGSGPPRKATLAAVNASSTIILNAMYNTVYKYSLY